MTEEEVNNLTSSMSALTKQLEKNNAALLLSEKSIDNQEKDLEDMLNHASKLGKTEKERNGTLKEIRNNISSTLKDTIKIGNVLGTIGTTAFAANILKDMIKLDNQMVALSVRMGKGHQGIRELKSSVINLQKEFGTSYENASLLVGELSKNKYVGNIKEAAGGIDLFSRASGVASSEVLELTNNLSKSAGLSTGAINAMYSGMLKVQQQVGISEKGMNSLVRTINDMSMNMAAFGKSSEEIKQMSNETTVLVGAMEKVGIEASRSTQIIEQLADPDRIEDNIMLYSQLGISMQDAISGSIDPKSLGPQFKEMAERIYQMGPIAGSSFAKSMGLSFKDVSKMAKMNAEDLQGIGEKAATPEEQALETMKSLEKATEGLGTQFETAFNKVEGHVKNLPSILLVGLAFLAPMLIKKGKQIFHKIFNKKDVQSSVDINLVPPMEKGIKKIQSSINTGIIPSMENGIKKIQSSINTGIIPSMENGIKKVGDKVSAGTKIAKNSVDGFLKTAFDSTKIGGFFDGAEARIDALYAKATKGKGITGRIFDASQKNLIDEYEARIVELDGEAESLSAKASDLGINFSDKINSNGKVKVDADFGKGTEAENKALKEIAARYNEIKTIQEGINVKKLKSLGITGNNLANYKEHNEILLKAKRVKEKAESQEKEINSLYNQRIEAQKKLDQLEKEGKTLKGSSAELNKQMQNQAEKQINSLDQQIKGQEDILKIKRKQEIAEIQIKKQEGEINKIVTDSKNKSQGWFGNLTKAAGMGIKGLFEKTGIGKSITDNISKASDGGKIKLSGGKKFGIGALTVGVKAIGGAIKKVGGAIKGLMKTFGPMALVSAVAGRLLSKIQEPLSRVLDQVADNLAPLMDQLFPILEDFINVVATKFLPNILNLMATAVNVLHHILAPVRWILKGLGHLPGKIGESFEGFAKTLDDITGPKVVEGLRNASDNLEKQSYKLEASSEHLDNASDKISDEDNPTIIKATGNALVASNGYTDPSIKASERMTTTSTVISGSSEEALEKEKADKFNKNNAENINNINNNTSSLPKILNLIEAILDSIKDGFKDSITDIESETLDPLNKGFGN